MTDGSHDSMSPDSMSHDPPAGPAPGRAPGSGRGRAHLLWDNGNGTAAVWRLGPGGAEAPGASDRRQFGPFAGWAARALAVGADGRAYLLWAGRDRTASVWSVDMAGGEDRHREFGPFPGWEARTLAVGPDGVLRVLWAGADGAAALWSLREEGLREGAAPESLVCGPYAGWAAVSLAVGPDGQALLLWTRADGAASVWRVGADGLAQQTEHGPYEGWSAVAVAAGQDGAIRLLWKSAGGYASLRDFPGGGEASGGAGPDNHGQGDHGQTVHGPFEGWTPAAVAQGADGQPHLLWRYNGGGLASVWRLAGADGVGHREYGPYAGWTPVALALGP